MLRITAHSDAESATLKLEGRLARPWVDEAELHWRVLTHAQPGRPVRLDVARVTSTDAAGQRLLAMMLEQEAKLKAIRSAATDASEHGSRQVQVSPDQEKPS